MTTYKPDNTPTLIPYLTVLNAKESVEFYSNSFGFNAEQISKDDKQNITHVEMRRDDVVIMFCPEWVYADHEMPLKSPISMNITMPINLYLYCRDVDALYKQAIDNGAKSIQSPQNTFWGDRFCQVLDINGYFWSFGTFLGDEHQ